jgi:uncharacterized secreted repeat protein (TIGR03808 family)
MDITRRSLMGAGVGAGLGAAGLGAGLAASAAEAGPRPDPQRAIPAGWSAGELGVEPGTDRDQTERLQAALDRARAADQPLWLAPGRYQVGRLELGRGARILGVPGATVLAYRGGGAFLVGRDAGDVRLEGLVLDGGRRPLADPRASALLTLDGSSGLAVRDVTVRDSAAHGITLRRCAGRIADCTITGAAAAGLFSRDAGGLLITQNEVSDCADNGILVWRTQAGEDGTVISGNRIQRIAARSGGSGQNGNGINVFRAGSVLVANNRITDCAYTAVRGNSASNLQILANSCARLGEVALYAEFAFEGALIANNLIDTAAAGISVTNFNEGGRLAIVQGNLVRNLSRREHEPVDKRGEGIAVEADTVVTGNVIESAQTAGLVIGWGRHMREVTATANLIRNAPIGIGITGDPAAGAALIAHNTISGARDGAIRSMRLGTAFGPDLARTPPAGSRLQISGNLVA